MTFYFYAYTIGHRWGGDNGVQCRNLTEARRMAQGFAEAGDCMEARVSVSRMVGAGSDASIATLLVERHTEDGFVAVEEAP